MVVYIRKCSRGFCDQVVVIEISLKEMRTRAMAVDEGAAEKRRKVGNGELRLPTSTFVQITTEEDARGPFAAAGSLGSDHVSSSCCSGNGSMVELQFTNLKESAETGTLSIYDLDTRASKPKSEFKVGSGLPELITAKQSTVANSRRIVPAEKIPPAAELEEFFASAEKDLHKRFKDKYNYDIVNDTPLEGRFEWVELKP